MRGFRAKDADRDRFVELIEAAYVDGQLGTEDRELRITRALSAETLDELETLTRDLQMPAGYVPPAPSQPPATRGFALPGRLVGLVVALGLVAVLVAVGVASLLFFASSGTDSSTSTSTASESAGVEPVPVAEESEQPSAPSFVMTAPQVRKFLRAYEQQFGTTEVYEAGFYPGRVGVQVPVRGSRPRMERWAWTGAWTQDTEAAAVNGPNEIVSLGKVDVGRMFANIATAKKSLSVERGKLTHVLVNFWIGDVPSVNIYIANSFNESGYLKTTLSGDVIGRFPYDS